jgi:asparagine synthetase B (glutamine-hydrolysing)
LQGRYSFVIYDSDKRCAYASRDPYGEESLFYFLDAEGAAHFSNLPMDVPDYPNTASKWIEVPPGCCVRIKPGKHKHSKVEKTPGPAIKADSRLVLPLSIDSPTSIKQRLSPAVPVRLSQEFSSGSDTAEEHDEATVETMFPLE